MGKLMKLIAQKDFKNDPYHIQNRSKTLFKNYAKLSLPVLAPTRHGRGSMIVLSVPSGAEEDLIAEMRSAMTTLQEENLKLKQRVKVKKKKKMGFLLLQRGSIKKKRLL